MAEAGVGLPDSILVASDRAEAARLAALDRDARVRAFTAARFSHRHEFGAARRALDDSLAAVFLSPYDADLSIHAPAVRAALLQYAAAVRAHDADPAVRGAAGLDVGMPAGLADRLRRVRWAAVAAHFPAAHPARIAVELLLVAVDSPDQLVGAVGYVLSSLWARAALGWLPLLAALVEPADGHLEPAGVFVPEDSPGGRVWRRAFGPAPHPDLQPLLAHAWYTDRERLAWVCGKGDPARTDALFPDPAAADPVDAPAPIPVDAPAPAPAAGPHAVDARSAPAELSSEPARPRDTSAVPDGPTLALALLATVDDRGRRPTMSDIAAAVGVSRQRLYDSPEFEKFRQAARRLGVMKVRSGPHGLRGHRTADGRVEAHVEADD